MDFSGQMISALPECFGKLTALEYLNLKHVKCKITFPVSIGDMPNLKELHIGGNILFEQPPEVNIAF